MIFLLKLTILDKLILNAALPYLSSCFEKAILVKLYIFGDS